MVKLAQNCLSFFYIGNIRDDFMDKQLWIFFDRMGTGGAVVVQLFNYRSVQRNKQLMCVLNSVVVGRSSVRNNNHVQLYFSAIEAWPFCNQD